MKKIIFVFGITGLFFTACKEKAPNINFSTAVTLDTTYIISPVPATDPHNVLMEEFTGQSCSNCPAAHEVLTALEAAHPGRINVAGLYVYSIQQTEPPSGAAYDLRDTSAWEISKSIYGGVNTLPIGGVDRSTYNGSLQIGQGNWSGLIIDKLSMVDSLNLNITTSYNSATNEDTITATIIYTKPVSSPHNLSVIVVEDSIIDKQEYPAFDPNFPSGMDDAYVFTNVFRDMVSSVPYGDPVLTSITTKEAGRVYKHIYIYHPKATFSLPHCRVIAFVSSNNGTNGYIMQSAQTELKP